MLFMEGLAKTLPGWVKHFMPNTLNKSISKTRDMDDATPKNNSFSKPSDCPQFVDNPPP